MSSSVSNISQSKSLSIPGKAAEATRINDLPAEIMAIILQKSKLDMLTADLAFKKEFENWSSPQCYKDLFALKILKALNQTPEKERGSIQLKKLKAQKKRELAQICEQLKLPVSADYILRYCQKDLLLSEKEIIELIPKLNYIKDQQLPENAINSQQVKANFDKIKNRLQQIRRTILLILNLLGVLGLAACIVTSILLLPPGISILVGMPLFMAVLIAMLFMNLTPPQSR